MGKIEFQVSSPKLGPDGHYYNRYRWVMEYGDGQTSVAGETINKSPQPGSPSGLPYPGVTAIMPSLYMQSLYLDRFLPLPL